MGNKEYIERGEAILAVTRDGCTANVVGVLLHMPAADVVEVRHGAYVYDDNKFPIVKCSVCGIKRNCETEHGWNYCSYCGARMDGERKDKP